MCMCEDSRKINRTQLIQMYLLRLHLIFKILMLIQDKENLVTLWLPK